jgi:hypothetical protein
MYRILFVFCVLLFLSTTSIFGQGSAAIREAKKDSVKPIEYNYVLPILGQKVAQKGFQLPYFAGVMVNNFVGVQDLSISGLKVGFNNNGLYNLDSIVNFNKVSADAYTLNVRVDTWIFPFWDFYVLGGYSSANTNIVINKPFDIETTTKSEGYYAGLGSTLAFGIRNYFGSLDMNYLWNFQDLLEEPAKVFTTGLRAGPIFRLKNHKESNFIIWTGVLFTNLNSETVGNIPFSEVFPNSSESPGKLQGKLDAWYEELSPAKQVLYEDLYNGISDGLSSVGENVSNSTIQYEMQKNIDRPFNMILGGQYQINLRWQLRAEAQFLGDRTGALLSLNYRFRVKGKNFLSN